jgi:hypothetical protein
MRWVLFASLRKDGVHSIIIIIIIIIIKVIIHLLVSVNQKTLIKDALDKCRNIITPYLYHLFYVV